MDSKLLVLACVFAEFYLNII